MKVIYECQRSEDGQQTGIGHAFIEGLLRESMQHAHQLLDAGGVRITIEGL